MQDDRLLLIVEDDAAFARTLGRSFERRGYQVILATNFDEASALLEQHCPDYAVVDLKLNGNTSGLACVQMLHQHDPEMLIVVLTGYASIGTAVEAIKLAPASTWRSRRTRTTSKRPSATWQATPTSN